MTISSLPAFANPMPLSSASVLSSNTSTICHAPPMHTITPSVSVRPARMTATTTEVTTDVANEAAVWPPAGMTTEWAQAIQRLSSSVKGATLQSADSALDEADGDEMLALRYLTEDNVSEIQKRRQLAVQTARENGDLNRVSAIKEAEIRRRATGSAKDFFKGYVEVEGQYVDSGYVDSDADAMGKLANTFKNWFGKK